MINVNVAHPTTSTKRSCHFRGDLSDPFKTTPPRPAQPVGMSTTTTTNLTTLMNVGPAVARYLALADVTQIDDLADRNPVDLFETICTRAGQRLDPCLLDTIMSAIDQANGRPARPWWTYTSTRKKLLP